MNRFPQSKAASQIAIHITIIFLAQVIDRQIIQGQTSLWTSSAKLEGHTDSGSLNLVRPHQVNNQVNVFYKPTPCSFSYVT